jgi:hypothetical protein
MQNKLQELTDKLYQDGLSKGKQEAQALLQKAQQEAQALVQKAKEQAEAIVSAAQKEMAEQQANTQNELKMAAQQSLVALKSEIEHLVVAKTLQPPIQKAVSEVDFIKSMIIAALEAFNPKGESAASLELLLPASKKAELETALPSLISRQLQTSLNISFSEKVKSGFTLAPKDGGYQLRFSDTDFEALFSEYLRPKTRQFLFGA